VTTGNEVARNDIDLETTRLHILELGDRHVLSEQQSEALVQFVGLAHGDPSNDRMLRFLKAGLI
jgi:hypothetical protein